jgi:hypothetical protein
MFATPKRFKQAKKEGRMNKEKRRGAVLACSVTKLSQFSLLSTGNEREI